LTPEQREYIDKLWKLQEVAHESLQAMADHMAKMAELRIGSQDEMDRCFSAWQHTQELSKKIDHAIRKFHGLA
jgi:hypothetical protein